ncbi:MAG: DnaJ domain-containing protein [Leptolyngbyaceae cyanobacterium]
MNQTGMDLVNCYHVLGLQPGASFADVKAAYRRLARHYHPDVNPDNVEWANQHFIEVTEAYQFIFQLGEAAAAKKLKRDRAPASSPTPSPSQPVRVKVHRPPPTVQSNPQLSEMDNRLKQQSYSQLQVFLKDQRFPRAIALVEGLAQRIPDDPEVQQWQAITYQQWARYLAEQKDYHKARIYLKKALKANPHNRRLWTEVKQDFQRIEQAIVRGR